MSKIYFGADSVTAIDQVIPVLQKEWGVIPSVWARYAVDPQYACTRAEVDLCRKLNIHLVLVDNSVTAPGGSAGTESDGHAAALRFVAFARSIGVPKTAGFADIERDQPFTTGWGLGWSRGLQSVDWPGGFYANTLTDAFNGPYDMLAPHVPRKYRLVWTAQHDSGYAPPTALPPFNPARIPGYEDVTVGVQFAINVVEGLIDENQWTEELYHLCFPEVGQPLPDPLPYTGRVVFLADTQIRSEPSRTNGTVLMVAEKDAEGQGLNWQLKRTEYFQRVRFAAHGRAVEGWVPRVSVRGK